MGQYKTLTSYIARIIVPKHLDDVIWLRGDPHPMRTSIFQVDAFASRPFEGNPAAICPLESWLPDATLPVHTASHQAGDELENMEVLEMGKALDELLMNC